jgi:hypothetical protein
VRADDGEFVILETIRVGRTLCTSVEAIQRFCDRLTSARSSHVTGPRSAGHERDDTALECEARKRGL